MNTAQIDKIIIKLAELSDREFNYFDLKDKYAEHIEYGKREIGRFIDHLIQKGEKINLAILRNYIPKDQKKISKFLQDIHHPILVFSKNSQDEITPIVIYTDEKNEIHFYDFSSGDSVEFKGEDAFFESLVVYEDSANPLLDGQVIFLTVFPLDYVVTDYYSKEEERKKLHPVQRLFRLLNNEKKDIFYVYMYAIVVGIISLSLPLGVQATISQISGGMFFSSVVVLITLVILGIVLAGALQIMQITLVEILQQRIFAKASFELAFRITRIKNSAFEHIYPPELMNRFFDVITVQKGLPKFFIDITGAILQITFGLLLLSLYHPFFLIFSIFVLAIVIAIFYVTGPNGLKTSIMESKYKYKIAFWLEELARAISSFKQAGNTNLPIQKMDDYVNSYLYYRKSHFRILLSQFINMLLFKTIITGGLLVLGTVLVVERQITLGQFVASEVVIILVVGSVEKLILSIDVMYDLLTGLDKLGQVTDLPLERQEGLKILLDEYKEGVHIQVKGLKYKYPDSKEYSLKGVSFEVLPGESLCIVGPNNSGKHTLVKVLAGALEDYEGIVTINHASIRDLNLNVLREAISKDLSEDGIFYGTILDNITMGRGSIQYNDVVWAIQNVGLADYIASLPDGLYTIVGASGKHLSSGIVTKLILARCVAARPKILIINDFSEHISKREKMKILSFLQDKSNGWNLIILSMADDPILLSACDKVMLMDKGEVAAIGNYEQLLSNKNFQSLIFKSI
ncbi:MAG: ATP-binding cassette domain-containing protein [Microscillaceae bacterium]|nr:ATP-binding cassette domain-containing protein [Microscillaceae bacterium]MDW8459829.1 ATP-binding cassette domain-containing protein [Cytophagales bacterium]